MLWSGGCSGRQSAGRPAPRAPPRRGAGRRDALVGRLFEATIGVADVFTSYIGDRLGLYAALAERGSATSTQLAEATGTHERYVREWLEQQASTGILAVEDATLAPTERRFS